MKLPEHTIIAKEKLTGYLLEFKKRNDKSQWLAKAGYSRENWKILENDLRKQILSKEAVCLETTEYGRLYEIKGIIIGPNGTTLLVRTIWMIETETDISKFITMYPSEKEL